MKNKFQVFNPAVFSIFMFFAVFAVPASALDIGIFAGAGNFSFDPELTQPLGDETVPKPFEPKMNPVIRAVVSGEAGFISYEGGFTRSPVLRNRLFANIGIDLSFFKMNVGPFIGLFNTKKEIFNPGFSAGMSIMFPGIVFIDVNASSSLGNALGTTGSYTQKTGELSAGFWVPNVICSLNLQSYSFTIKEKPNLTIDDSLVKYFFRADVFAKNVPFTIKVDIGYGLLSRSYYTQSITGTLPDLELSSDVISDEFKFIYLGLEAFYRINPMFKIFLSGEMPVYSWSAPKMKNPAKGTFIFQSMAGVVITL